jgi:hypothetical protein
MEDLRRIIPIQVYRAKIASGLRVMEAASRLDVDSEGWLTLEEAGNFRLESVGIIAAGSFATLVQLPRQDISDLKLP